MTKKKTTSAEGTPEDKKAQKKDQQKETAENSAKLVQEDIDALRDRLKEKEAEAAEYLDSLRRLQADFENYKKRMLKEQTEFAAAACKDLVVELIPVLDNFERALKAGGQSKDSAAFCKGMEMVHGQLVEILKRAGLDEIDPLGQEFDPLHHEAVLQVGSDEHEDNTVVEVMQKGYELKGKLLRPAAVKVSKKNS
jgi:molecular chaperone GrpE